MVLVGEKNGSSGFLIVIFPKHFSQTLLVEALLPSGGGYTEGQKAGLSVVVVAVLGCGLNKHTQSPNKVGEHETNFQFFCSF